jgi:hypothetical protein
MVSAQRFVGQATLPPVEVDGFYRIVISPDVALHLSESCANIRVHDEANKEIPYLFQTGRPTSAVVEFKEYEIVEKRYEEGCCTTLVLHNPGNGKLNNINLVIKNADVTKYAQLLGSDDQEHWYALKQRFELRPTMDDSSTSEIEIVNFPLSNYAYYSLRIEDSLSAPLNILSAGYFQHRTSEAQYTRIPDPAVIVSDSVSQKMSYVRIKFDTSRLIDKMELSLSGTPYFLRKATLYEPRSRILRNGNVESFNSFMQELQLTSKHPTTIELGGPKIKELLLVVENDDNPSLNMDIHRAYQLDRYLTVFLKSDMDYTIKVGNHDLGPPVYDISFFTDKIPLNPPTLEVGQVVLLTKATADATFTFFTSRVFIWVAIVLVIGILAIMSFRILKETPHGGSDTK